MIDTKTDNPLLKQVPQILRARGYRLYTKDNRRLIDLWLNGGAALLGHTPPNILRELKNTASRGLYAPYPHFTEGRLLKALSKLLPEYSFCIYATPPQEFATLFSNGKASLWRPFMTADTSNPFHLILPGIQIGLCVIAAKSEEQLAQLPPNELISPIVLATAARGIHDLIASPQRAHPHLPRTYKALKADICPWRREGIYLYLKDPPDEKGWAAYFDKFLQAGFLLPPTPEHPVILPGELSDGEDAKLAEMLGILGI